MSKVKKPEVKNPNPVAWRVEEWRQEFRPAISRSQIHQWIGDGTLPSSKPGGMRLILVSPQEFLERHREPAEAR